MKLIKSKTDLIINSVYQHIQEYLLTDRKISILLAFSAGPDSTVLLDVLYRLGNSIKIDLICAYFDHKLRSVEDIDKEINIAQNLCMERGIELVIGSDKDNYIKSISKKNGIEAAARKSRYLFLTRTAEEKKIDYITAAHNLDDQIETLVMRFFSGSGIEGLKGMPETNGKIIRPLIKIPKCDILDYLRENSISYSKDSTNKSMDYLRNKVRLSLIPAVKEIFPGIENSLSELSDKMIMADRLINSEYEKYAKWKLTKNGDYEINFDLFMSMPDYIKIKAVYNVFNLTSRNEERLPYGFIKPLLLKNNQLKSNILLKGYGFRLERAGNSLFWKTDIVIKNKNSYLLNIRKGDIGSLHDIPYKYKNLIIFIEEVNRRNCTKNDIWVSPDKLKGNIYIRSRKDGDSIILSEGRKKIKKILQEYGVIHELRDFIPIICDDNGIIAVWGSVFGYKNRIADRIIDRDSLDNNVLIFRMRQE